MTNILTALMVEPGKRPFPILLCNNTDYLRRAVSRDTDWLCEPTMAWIDTDVVVLFNDEAVLLDLPGNRRVGKRILAGTFYVLGFDRKDLRSLTADEIVRYTVRFWEIEEHSYDEVLDAHFSVIYDEITSDCPTVFSAE